MDTEPMSALPSSEFATSSAPLIRTSPKSKTSWPSATDGGAKRPWRRRLRLVRRLAHSLTLKLEIGRASCRERVCQYVSISVAAVHLKKTNTNKRERAKQQIEKQ